MHTTVFRRPYILKSVTSTSSVTSTCCCKVNGKICIQPLNYVHTGIRYPHKNRWLWRVGAPVGIGLIGYWLFKKSRADDVEGVNLAKSWEVSLYRTLPLRAMSRAWGQFNELSLPQFSRKPLLSIYVKMFGCKVEEAIVEDLKQYKNLGEFFRRPLKPDVRPVDTDHSLVMPSDGKVLNFGNVEDGVIEQVKGVNYSLKGFLGPNNQWLYQNTNNNNLLSTLEMEKKLQESDQELKVISDKQYYSSLLQNKENRLYHTVVYLAPGDYHRFHSPANWTVEHRRHFPGDLLSVNPMIASYVQGLFNMNERAVYTGKWKHGFFSMTAVGATNVGSIRTYFDETLETNLRKHSGREMTYDDMSFTDGINFKRGDAFGEFRLGSTIVLIFEAPKSFDFTEMSLNKSVKMGEALGDRTAINEKRSSAAQA